MLIARLMRGASSDEGTFGVLIYGAASAQTAELPWRDNRRGRSCIPASAYTCRLVRSPRFGRVYEVQHVPGRSHILIHAANLAGDVDRGFDTDLLGCIAPAARLGLLRNSQGRRQAAGLVSAPALRSFMAWAGGAPFVLEVENA